MAVDDAELPVIATLVRPDESLHDVLRGKPFT
jgi:hypothetical protein